MAPQVVVFGYDGSPKMAKVLQYLTASQIDYNAVDCSLVPPRPDLRKLGIAYRRIPVVAIGKDVYCDSALQLDVLQAVFSLQALPTSQADEAYATWAQGVSTRSLTLLPLKAFPEGVAADRIRLFPGIFNVPDIETYRPSALAEVYAALEVMENKFLGHGSPFVCGNQFSMADVHLGYVIQRAVKFLTPAMFANFPRIQAWLDRIPVPNPKKIPASEAIDDITSAGFVSADLVFDINDPLELKQGTIVKVEQTDDSSGLEPQTGELIGLSRTEVVLGLETGIRLHFPRIGTVVRSVKVG